MRLIFAGTPEVAVVALEKLIASNHEVVAVLTRPDAPKGRGRSLHPSPVAEVAKKYGIEILTPKTLKAATEDGIAVRARIAELAPDCVPVVAYGNLLPKDVLEMVPHGFINLHFSLLPRWRGAAPVQAAIIHGDLITGASTFRIDEGLDTGEVAKTIEEPIATSDTADDLLTRLAYRGGDLLVQTMDEIAAGTAVFKPQEGEATHISKISKNDARIIWTQPAAVIDRLIRGVTPAPGAWTELADQRFKIGPVKLVDSITLAPGSLHIEKKRVLVGTGDTAVELGSIQAPGKKMMPATDWARGLASTEGLMFQ